MSKKHPHLIEGFEERLKIFFGVETGQELAEMFSENNNTFNFYLTGRTKVPYDLLLKIYEKSTKRRDRPPISLSWLLTGEGSMYAIIQDYDFEARDQFVIKEFLMKLVLSVSGKSAGVAGKKSEMK